MDSSGVMSSESTPSQQRGTCVIMAGGRGTRFWPLSRSDRPKQLHALASGKSLLRETFERVAPVVGAERVLVITSGSLAAATQAELPELPPENVITEPVGRNTAPCAVLGVGIASRLAPGEPVALLPADHFIPDGDVYRAQLVEAMACAKSVVTIGIRPDRPETGYGYIETDTNSDEARVGVQFVEKPDLATAEGYVRGGRHLWNSGMFIWNPEFFAATAAAEIPDIVAKMAPAVESFGTSGFETALAEAYRDCPADSLDFAVMEKLSGFTVLPANFRWSDLGSWDAWGELADPLVGSNRGLADLLSIESEGNVIRVQDRLVALIGVRDMIIVDTDDALLVCRKSDAQRIKEIINQLEDRGRQDLL
ncbi:MAG: mannose-1-phosphate guanylyltransferase [Candidatus Krumholzibacteriia bacterium]|jgi:mannose-1-phosphate guanylyltransferase